jgi:hypothetical protein
VLKRRAPYFLCSAFPALIGAICRIRGRSSPVRAADEEFDAEPRPNFDSVLQVEKIDSLRSLVKVLGRECSWAAVPGIDDSATLANTSLW